MGNLDDKIIQLEQELARLYKQKTKNQETLKFQTPRKWKFEFFPRELSSFHFLRPNTGVTPYYLRGTISNLEECRMAGWSNSDLMAGGILYIFNTFSKKIMGHIGGGNLYITEKSYFNKEANPEKTFTQLEDFLLLHPEGGDVTDIIISQPGSLW